jgi:hypothetical protein
MEDSLASFTYLRDCYEQQRFDKQFTNPPLDVT